MTRSVTPGAGAPGAQNSISDYSLGDDPNAAAANEALDDDLIGDVSEEASGAISGGIPAGKPRTRQAQQEQEARRADVPDELAGERLDKVLAKVFPEFSRNRLQSWIEAQRVLVDGKPAKVRQPVPLGATIELVPDLLPEQLAFTPEPVPLEIIYEDDAIVVINKPAGLVVHPAAGNWSGTILNGLLHRYGEAAAGLPRAGIVHRLDKETSGLMVVARTLEAQTDLVRQLQARTVKRRYLALVWGNIAESGTIDAPIGRDSRERTRMAVVKGASGKPARTHFRRIDKTLWHNQPVSAIHCDLETGRTHQIRVHCAAVGHPLLGDPVYGHARGKRSVAALPNGFARQALHAWRLGLIHPVTGRAMQWRAEVPDDMDELIEALGFGAEEDEDGFDDMFDSAYTDEGYVIGSNEEDYADDHDDEDDGHDEGESDDESDHDDHTKGDKPA
ncbi:RluA family pseudouridine synthase [Paraburkholderia tropica]|uniref:Ribosomal large subunit pseudouridine synthase D n=1 Tax=Paraburkholderia tropica TaxID=92647 RepID=A0A1A5XEL5_9BURK|nr:MULTISPECIES: RluA family pseudouridine synthase [Paraburkholderia]MDE1141022.1 RluA family pseudouridine synthase [Paraburkholderia tropica]OBR51620.1 pseudouridine synthase [Paraburkholderia tropica]PXX14640.1 ribosomal large subunit pseudouridine synthase D [Paraburkholderia tropica]PZW79705.1 ribosomal large subunit pseudouridine synthase D [Paraburkholderia tropica]RQM48548.1 RluA family pseudouridine synthase [Paraburkholderia bannensis]